MHLSCRDLQNPGDLHCGQQLGGQRLLCVTAAAPLTLRNRRRGPVEDVGDLLDGGARFDSVQHTPVDQYTCGGPLIPGDR